MKPWLSRPFRATLLSVQPFPRALPWAFMLQAFQPKNCASMFVYRLKSACVVALLLGSCQVRADQHLPSRNIPTFDGQTYTAIVPDTLDLAERMKLSLHAITRCIAEAPTDRFPPTRYLANHFILLKPEGPKVFRDVNLYGKAMLGALLARIATGSDERMEVDNNWRAAWLKWQEINPVMHGPEGGRRMEWIAMNIRRETGANREAWKVLARRAVDRLATAMATSPDGNALVAGHIIADDGFEDEAAANKKFVETLLGRTEKFNSPEERLWYSTYMTWTLQGLCALYRETGDRQTLELASQLANYLKNMSQIITADGRMHAGHEHEHPNIHWHHSYQVAIACAEYGLVSHDEDFLEFANAAYQHGLSLGSRDIGFAPEYCYQKFPREQDFDNTEACCTSDLIHSALWLTLSGHADYWDDIDRFVRNQLAALQLTDTRWFYELPENRGKWIFPDTNVEKHVGPLVGNFGGWSTPNEWHIPELGCGIMTCCLGNCTRAMYYVWENMVQFSDDQLTVHLMLNRGLPQADIHSYRPNLGKLVVQVKQDFGRLRVRAPEWIPTDSGLLAATRDGEPAVLSWDNRYVVMENPRAGETITITFPITTRTVETTIGRQDFTLTIRGNTVVKVDPPGERMPLYQRDHMQSEQVPMHSVTRFMPK